MDLHSLQIATLKAANALRHDDAILEIAIDEKVHWICTVSTVVEILHSSTHVNSVSTPGARHLRGPLPLPAEVERRAGQGGARGRSAFLNWLR